MADWYYQIDKRVYGPYPDQEMRDKIKSGAISPNTQVSRNGFTDWQEASQCLVENKSRSDKKEKPNKPPRNFSRSPFSQWNGLKAKIGAGSRLFRQPLFWCLGIVLALVVAGAVVVKAGHGKRVIRWARRLLSPSHSDQGYYTLENTRTYWLAMQRIENTANKNLLKLPDATYPTTTDGQPDMLNFGGQDFQQFKQFQLEKAQMARDYIEKLDKLPAVGVDPGLLRYKLELSDLWSLIERASGELAEITADTAEQQSCFASPETYALRFSTNSANTSEADYQFHKSHEQIAKKVAQLKAMAQEATEAQANITGREQEVKTLLTSRYGSKFE